MSSTSGSGAAAPSPSVTADAWLGFSGCLDPLPEPTPPAPHSAPADLASNTLFMSDEVVSIPVPTAGATGSIRATVFDAEGRLVWGPQSQPVSNSATAVQPPPLGVGYFVLHVDDQTAAGAPVQDVAYTVMRPFTAPAESPFGANTHLLAPEVVRLMARGGMKWARNDVPWATVEAGEQGTFDFSAYAPFAAALAREKLEWLLLLTGTHPSYDSGQAVSSSDGLEGFARYAEATVRQFKGQVRAAELYNAPNGAGFTPEAFAALLAYAYPAVKSAAASMEVVGTGLFLSDASWVQALGAAGGLAHMDAFSHHPYTGDPDPGLDANEKAFADAITAANGGRPMPLWITEFGWAVTDGVSDRMAARYAVRASALALSAGVVKLFYYDLINANNSDPNKQEQNHGLLRDPDAQGRITPKMPFVSYATMARMVGGARPVESRLSSLTDQSRHFTYAAGEGTDRMALMWTHGPPTAISLAARCPVATFDMFGRRTNIVPRGNQIVLPLSADPTYVLGHLAESEAPDFASGFEAGDQPAPATDQIDTSAGALVNVGDYSQPAGMPSAGTRIELNHTAGGSQAFLYAGSLTGKSEQRAAARVFDLADQNITLGPTSQISYWVHPISPSGLYGYAVRGDNSAFVDLSVRCKDGRSSRTDNGWDQYATPANPVALGQAGRRQLDAWNSTIVSLGHLAGCEVVAIDLDVSCPGAFGGYRGYIDDVAIRH